MKQEDKDLLLKDLSARLPYRVMVEVPGLFNHQVEKEPLVCIDRGFINDMEWPIENVRPYLFPISSMTKEQKKELEHMIKDINKIYSIDDEGDLKIRSFSDILYVDVETMMIYIDWLNAHHFDYRGLIEKGLAIDCTNLNIY